MVSASSSSAAVRFPPSCMSARIACKLTMSRMSSAWLAYGLCDSCMDRSLSRSNLSANHASLIPPASTLPAPVPGDPEAARDDHRCAASAGGVA